MFNFGDLRVKNMICKKKYFYIFGSNRVKTAGKGLKQTWLELPHNIQRNWNFFSKFSIVLAPFLRKFGYRRLHFCEPDSFRRNFKIMILITLRKRSGKCVLKTGWNRSCIFVIESAIAETINNDSSEQTNVCNSKAQFSWQLERDKIVKAENKRSENWNLEGLHWKHFRNEFLAIQTSQVTVVDWTGIWFAVGSSPGSPGAPGSPGSAGFAGSMASSGSSDSSGSSGSAADDKESAVRTCWIVFKPRQPDNSGRLFGQRVSDILHATKLTLFSFSFAAGISLSNENMLISELNYAFPSFCNSP